jgi:hypothetical protein
MATILDKISYDHTKYSELTDPTGRQEIEVLAERLKPLENEIANDPKGQITIMESGNIFPDFFEPELAKKITAILTGRADL